MRHFTIIITQEGRVRFRLLQKEHGLLHDKQEQKSYAIVHVAYPTNWAGRWSRAYLVYEESAQTVKIDPEQRPVDLHGASVRVLDPLNMLARIKRPAARGEEGEVREVHLTPESIFDRTQAAQVRRLGNRRIHWTMALLFAGVGSLITVILGALIILFSTAGTDDAVPPAIQIDPQAPAEQSPTSGPVQEPTIVVGSKPSLEHGTPGGG